MPGASATRIVSPSTTAHATIVAVATRRTIVSGVMLATRQLSDYQIVQSPVQRSSHAQPHIGHSTSHWQYHSPLQLSLYPPQSEPPEQSQSCDLADSTN